MSKIYISVAYGGAYENAWETNMAASLDLSKIEELNTQQEARVRYLKGIQEQVDAFIVERDNNVCFDRDKEYEKLLDLPKMPSDNKLITKEMRQERERIRNENAEIAQRNSAKYMEFYNERNDAIEAFARSIGFDEELPDGKKVQSFLYNETDVSYRIDEVEMI